MREALARTNHDYKVSRRATRPSKKNARPPALAQLVARGLLRQFWVRPATTIAGASFAALMTGIALNALVLQKVRHPAPLFGNAPHHAAAPVADPRPAVVPPAPTAAPAARAADATHKPAPPADAPTHDPITQLLKTGSASEPSEAAHNTSAAAAGDQIGHFLKSSATRPADDPVGQFLKHDAIGEAEAGDKNVLAAQRALAKLGYGVKPDGVLGQTTRQAIEHFQKDHHMIVNDRLTPRVMHELSAAVGQPVD